MQYVIIVVTANITVLCSTNVSKNGASNVKHVTEMTTALIGVQRSNWMRHLVQYVQTVSENGTHIMFAHIQECAWDAFIKVSTIFVASVVAPTASIAVQP